MRKSYLHSGDEISCLELGTLYEEGIGTEQDFVQAAKLCKEIADRRSGIGRLYSCFYGYLLIRGLEVTQNVKAGLRIVRRALEPGHGSATYVLGDCYRHGYGVKIDLNNAVRYFFKSVNSTDGGAHGIVRSDMALAEMYDSSERLEQNWTKAAHNYIRAADRMHQTAQWRAGTLLERGVGVDADVRRAFVFFDLSARSGHVSAQRKAGELYMRGKGVERDRTKALRLFEEAAERGDTRTLALLRRARRPYVLRWRIAKTDAEIRHCSVGTRTSRSLFSFMYRETLYSRSCFLHHVRSSDVTKRNQ